MRASRVRLDGVPHTGEGGAVGPGWSGTQLLFPTPIGASRCSSARPNASSSAGTLRLPDVLFAKTFVSQFSMFPVGVGHERVGMVARLWRPVKASSHVDPIEDLLPGRAACGPMLA